MRLGVLATVLVLALLPGAATARTVTCGEVITEDTVVDNELHCSAGPGLVIGADGVRLNLGGHTIQTAADRLFNQGFTAIDARGHDDVVIRNGTASGSGFFPGIWLTGSRARIVDVTAFGAFSFTVHGTDNVLRRLGGFQLLLSGDRATVTSSHDLVALVSGAGHRIADNQLRSLVVTADDATITRNLVPTIELEGDGNRVVRNRGVGSLVLDGAHGNLVAHNQVGAVADGSAVGIRVGQEAPATGNAIVDNLVVSVADVFFPGIWVGPGSTGTLLLRNRSDGNPGDGIFVQQPGTFLRRNVANGNGELGIDAVGATDGGGNRASGNADARQCVGVTCR
jgi:hypothetical protein